VKERPILFSAPMVRAILAGTKTQTRRVVKPQPAPEAPLSFLLPQPNAKGALARWCQTDARGIVSNDHAVRCPYGMKSDRLYVRETWQHANHPLGPYDDRCAVFYRADYFDDPHGPDGELSPEGKYREWRPSIHMPRSASRILLEITGVRVERLHDISEADALDEGVPNSLHLPGGRFARENFAHLWWTINGDGAWEANPWVWVVEFQRVLP
jgi:hypothetical protein